MGWLRVNKRQLNSEDMAGLWVGLAHIGLVFVGLRLPCMRSVKAHAPSLEVLLDPALLLKFSRWQWGSGGWSGNCVPSCKRRTYPAVTTPWSCPRSTPVARCMWGRSRRRHRTFNSYASLQFRW